MAVELAEGVLIAKRYRLERLLGAGGMGTVWAARHEVTGRRHALKFLRGEPVALAEMRRRFVREARAACSVDHPNVVSVSDVFDLEDGTPVMVMDLLEGETLGDRLRRDRKLPLGDTADILLAVVSAVAAAHARGIVHRDLKPDNIFIDRRGHEATIRVLDFGVAKLVGAHAETGTVTRTGTLLGTPCYMSPEQAFGQRDVDYRSDLWSLGIILYEMLSGVRPVEGDNVGQVLKRLMQDGITPIEAMVDLPPDVSGLIGALLQRDRDERLSDLKVVFDVLAKYASISPPPIGDTPSFAPEPTERVVASRLRWRVIVPVVALAIAVAGFGLFGSGVVSSGEGTAKNSHADVHDGRTAAAPKVPAALQSAPIVAQSAPVPDAQLGGTDPNIPPHPVAPHAASVPAKPHGAPSSRLTAPKTAPTTVGGEAAGTVPAAPTTMVDKRHGLVEHPPF